MSNQSSLEDFNCVRDKQLFTKLTEEEAVNFSGGRSSAKGEAKGNGKNFVIVQAGDEIDSKSAFGSTVKKEVDDPDGSRSFARVFSFSSNYL